MNRLLSFLLLLLVASGFAHAPERKDFSTKLRLLPAAVKLAYDADENLISDGLHGYAYNEDASLASITVTNGWRSEFTYDGLQRRRVRKEYTWSRPMHSWTLP